MKFILFIFCFLFLSCACSTIVKQKKTRDVDHIEKKIIYNLSSEISGYKIQKVQYFNSPQRTQIDFSNHDISHDKLTLVVYKNTHEQDLQSFDDQLLSVIQNHQTENKKNFVVKKKTTLLSTLSDHKQQTLYATHLYLKNNQLDENLFVFVTNKNQHILVFNIQSNIHQQQFENLNTTLILPIIEQIDLKKNMNSDQLL